MSTRVGEYLIEGEERTLQRCDLHLRGQDRNATSSSLDLLRSDLTGLRPTSWWPASARCETEQGARVLVDDSGRATFSVSLLNNHPANADFPTWIEAMLTVPCYRDFDRALLMLR
ncbi:hypothetical protein D7V97_24130 [Corallococcus sp. CA053C]|nr:hypothetical protein D7V97_24130 [Corallococcus sp. CA053C]